jgi:two-component system NtrC family sensor kinase
LEVSTYPIYDDDDQVVQSILIEQDVTEKHRLEVILAQSERLVAVGQLAAGLAHEMNNPLTAIIANAQLLKRELPVDDDRQEMVDLITRAGERANHVVRSLLDLARKKEFSFVPTNINETVRNAIKLLQYEISARGVDLLFEPSENLPVVSASPDHLQGVWLNLISNALDAFEGPGGQVRISTHQEDQEVYVKVSDTGSGIPAENLALIFEPFFTTKQPGHGTGLGLSVCNRIVRQHGGRIVVDSETGAGSQFVVFLPIE